MNRGKYERINDMETETIKKIKGLHGIIYTNLDQYRNYYKSQGIDMTTNSFGSENEYSLNDIIVGVQSILTDVSYLVRSHNLFIKISTYNERNNIVSLLNSLNNWISSRNNVNVVNLIEALKQMLRSYNTRIDRNRFIEFSTEIDNVRKLSNDLNKDIEDGELKLQSATEIYNNIVATQTEYNAFLDEFRGRQDFLQKELEEFTKDFSDFKELAKRAQENEIAIAENLEKTNRSKNVFDKFVKEISERETILEEQAKKTVVYEETLEQYTKDYDSKMKSASYLIDEAKKALNYKNAEGLSAAFDIQLNDAKKWWNFAGWLIGATLFIFATLLIGAWIVTGWGLGDITGVDKNQMIFNLVGRLSMIPFTVAGAVFCANQYTKQKNIAEDYAYKTTIAKSIIAFSEELRAKEPEKYTEYISTILKEIHQDPLRKRGKCSDEFTINKESSGIIEKVIALLQSAINK